MRERRVHAALQLLPSARVALLVVLAGVACRPSPTAQPTPTSPPVGTPTKPTPSAAPSIAITDVACDPRAEPWEIALAGSYAWGLSAASDVREVGAKRSGASALIDALPSDDPRYVEAHCRAGFAQYNIMNVAVADRHFARALAELRERGIRDAEARYATAAEPAFSVSLFFGFDPQTKLAHRVSLGTTTGVSRDPDDCRTPDIALLELARAGLYGSANSAQMKGVPKDRTKGSVGSMSADTVIALHAEVEAALGPRHRLTFAMREHVSWQCDEKQERKFPKQCPTLDAVRERNLADRTAVLGAEHPDTRYSALFLGGDQLEAGKVDEARRLFDIAAGGEPDDWWIAANQLLAGLDFDAGRDREGFARLQRVAQALPIAASDAYWDSLQAWRLHEEAARATGHREEAERERAAIEASYSYVGPGGPSMGLVAGTAAGEPLAELHELALNSLVLGRTHQLRDRSLSPAARAWRIAELDTALQCRALMYHRAGNETAAKNDLNALASLRATTTSYPGEAARFALKPGLWQARGSRWECSTTRTRSFSGGRATARRVTCCSVATSTVCFVSFARSSMTRRPKTSRRLHFSRACVGRPTFARIPRFVPTCSVSRATSC